MELSELDLGDLAPKRIVIKEGGKVKFVLVEASEEAHRLWSNALMRNTRKVEGGGVEMTSGEGLGDIYSILLARCLYAVAEDGKETLLTLAQVRALPTRITRALYKHLRTISGMDAEEKKEENEGEEGYAKN